jgi:hypothetical protein
LQNVSFVGFMLRGLAILKQDDHSAELRRGDIAVLDSTYPSAGTRLAWQVNDRF